MGPNDTKADAEPPGSETEQMTPDSDQVRHEAERVTADADRVASDSDQAAADADQVASNSDQVAADADQVAATADQVASDADQAQADREQSAADLDHASRDAGAADDGYEISRLERLEAMLSRDQTAALRLRIATERDRTSERRDELAQMRDLASDARDRAADDRDIAAARAEGDYESLVGLDEPSRERILEERRRIVDVRTRAAADRERAARDRAEAARNRIEAAHDREQAAQDRRHASVDELTGTYRRGVGLLSFERELERSRRTKTTLCLAFVDVDGLKHTNDTAGHDAGDELLRRVGTALKAELRPYDSVVRVGGDEFACAISDVDLAIARTRFDRIAEKLATGPGNASISVGIVAIEEGESVNDALTRADAYMREDRRVARKLSRDDPGAGAATRARFDLGATPD